MLDIHVPCLPIRYYNLPLLSASSWFSFGPLGSVAGTSPIVCFSMFFFVSLQLSELFLFDFSNV